MGAGAQTPSSSGCRGILLIAALLDTRSASAWGQSAGRGQCTREPSGRGGVGHLGFSPFLPALSKSASRIRPAAPSHPITKDTTHLRAHCPACLHASHQLLPEGLLCAPWDRVAKASTPHPCLSLPGHKPARQPAPEALPCTLPGRCAWPGRTHAFPLPRGMLPSSRTVAHGGETNGSAEALGLARGRGSCGSLSKGPDRHRCACSQLAVPGPGWKVS